MKRKWVQVFGETKVSGNKIVFKGKPITYTDPQGKTASGWASSQIISNEFFAGGSISADVKFHNVQELWASEIIFSYNPSEW